MAILDIVANLDCRRILERTAATAPTKADGIGSGASRACCAPTARSPRMPFGWRDTTQVRSQPQCQSGDDFATRRLIFDLVLRNAEQ